VGDFKVAIRDNQSALLSRNSKGKVVTTLPESNIKDDFSDVLMTT
jgi:hypothetical protein